jgi:Domain of unknown function (DUF397)
MRQVIMSVAIKVAIWGNAERTLRNGACVEAASLDEYVLIRDSVNPAGGDVAYASRAWEAIMNTVKVNNHHPQCGGRFR